MKSQGLSLGGERKTLSSAEQAIHQSWIGIRKLRIMLILCELVDENPIYQTSSIYPNWM